MKVILLADVEKLGASHDVVEVADGFARNYLMPRGLATGASKSAMSQLDNMKRVEDRRQNRARAAAQELATKIEGKTIIMPARVGTGGRLYGSIGAPDIAEQLQAQLGTEVDRKLVQIPEAIREVGYYQVPVALHRDVRVTITVQVGDAAAIQAAQNEAQAARATELGSQAPAEAAA